MGAVGSKQPCLLDDRGDRQCSGELNHPVILEARLIALRPGSPRHCADRNGWPRTRPAVGSRRPNEADDDQNPVKISLGATYTHGDYFRLSAPGLDASSGITLGGRVMAADGTLPGVTRTALTVNGKTLSLTLPAGSTTVVTLTPSVDTPDRPPSRRPTFTS
jgi:hypothetical protein